ncbi:MAG: hypothetical protein HOH19_04250 [Kordiimonadaceae bacterium]|nr:hypothetical protein [Kordiimonadaceae bacterium]
MLNGDSPFLKNLLIEQDLGSDVSFESSTLTWRGAENNPTGHSSLEIRFQNITINNPETSMNLKIPQAGMQFSTTAIFRGVIAPTFVEFSGLDINLKVPKEAWAGEQFDQDIFIAAMRKFVDEFNQSQDLVPRLLKQMISKPGPLKSTGYLQQISLADTALNITDELSGDIWKIPDAMLDIKRIDQGLSLLLEGKVDIEDDMGIPLHTSIQYDINLEKITSQIRFSNFVPKNVAGKVEGLSALSTLNIPVSGIVDFSIDNEFNFPIFDFEFDVSEGEINPAELYNTPIKIEEAGMSGQFIAAEDTLSIENFFLKFVGAELEAEGMIVGLRNDPDVDITAQVINLPMINLKTYWPPNIVAGSRARSWIERNVTGGMITEGTIDVSIQPEMWALDILPDEGFVFKFEIENGSSHFLKPMPQVVGLRGTATLKANHFLLEVEHATVDEANLNNGVLNFIDTANRGKSTAHFELPITGRVEEILNIIDYQPLNFPTKFGVKKNSVLGDAQAHLTLKFPLIRDLKLLDIDFNVMADIEELSIPKLSDTLALSEGTMSMTVNDDGINASGDILLNGVDFKAQWVEDFTKIEELSTTYILEGLIENEEWDKLYLPFEPYVNGPAQAEIMLKGRGSNLATGNGSFDLVNTDITFEPLGWHKEVSVQADAIYNLEFQEGGVINVNDIAFGSEKLNSNLQLQFDGERTSRLYIRDLTMADTDFSALFEWDIDKALYQVSMNGAQFNAVPLMDIILGPDEEGDEEVDLPDFNFAGKIENISMYNDVTMHQTSVLAGYIDNEIIDFGYNGNWGVGKNLSIFIASNEDSEKEQQILTLQTNDAGLSLRGLDFFTSGDQGDLLIEADMTKEEKGYSFKGTMNAANFSVADSIVFSELLKAKEFTKAQEELEENGLSFETYESEFLQYDEVLTLTSGSAKGPTLGVTLDGFIDQRFDEISLSGTIIPAYGLNSLVSNIPLLGTILAGAKGEGIFSATYDMTGSIDDPEVSINPLMALAPGILRKLFGAIGDGGSSEPTLREEAEQIEENAKALEVPENNELPPVTPPN